MPCLQPAISRPISRTASHQVSCSRCSLEGCCDSCLACWYILMVLTRVEEEHYWLLLCKVGERQAPAIRPLEHAAVQGCWSACGIQAPCNVQCAMTISAATPVVVRIVLELLAFLESLQRHEQSAEVYLLACAHSVSAAQTCTERPLLPCHP